ncbi:IS3 family transposase [Acidaminococcus timonensis]|uniref:IS3 family transposase n=1 Tax=Acidaminococcus timonensis TaxID=1871002 RepID=UPI00248C19ED|nr:IS3 family transposase [Acidaminococcus timonensis]
MRGRRQNFNFGPTMQNFCEGFFGRLKNELFYNRSWSTVTIQEFMDILDQYIHWYAEKRIKVSLGGMSPIQYRKMQGIAV